MQEYYSNEHSKVDLIFLLYFVFYDTIFYYVEYIMARLPVIGMFATLFYPAFEICFFILLARRSKMRIKYNEGLIVLIILASILISMIVYNRNTQTYRTEYLDPFLLRCLPFFALGIIIKPSKDVLKYLGIGSHISLLIGVVYIWYAKNVNTAILSSDNMGLAYNYLVPTLLATIYAICYPNIKNIALAVLGSLMILSFGTRGPFLINLIFVGCLIIYKTNKHKRMYAILISIGLVIGIGLFSVFFSNIVNALSQLMSIIGISTRVVNSMVDQTFFQSKVRQDIRQIVWESIKEKPLIGHGVGGEWEFLTWNAHNLYLSVLHNFGIPIGGLFIGYVGTITLKAYVGAKEDFTKYIILMYVCLSLVRGFFGTSFCNPDLFFLIGFCESIKRKGAV